MRTEFAARGYGRIEVLEERVSSSGEKEVTAM
jgi:hypothetical protein